MSWQSDKSLKRIFNTFKRLKNNIFNEDIEALKQLNDELLNSQKSNVIDNILFAKMLCVHLRQNLEFYSDIKLAIKKSNDDLKQPLNFHLQVLLQSLNNTDKINYLKSLNIDFDGIDLQNESLTNEMQKEFIEKIKTNWSYDLLEKSFLKTTNEFINDVDNYV